MEQLVAEEIKRCETFLTKYPGLKTPPRMPVKTFVQRCAHMHRQLLEMWEGWEHQGPVTLIEDPTAAKRAAKTVYDKFVAAINTVLCKNGYEAGGFAAYGPRQFIVDMHIGADGVGAVAQAQNALCAKTIQENYDGYKLPSKGVYVTAGQYVERETRSGREVRKYIKIKARVGQRIAPLIMEALEDAGITKQWPDISEVYEKLFVQLGESVWVGQQVPVAVTLTARPSAFLSLGHYEGIDAGSCYRNAGLHDSSKLFLAADLPDSFVMLTYRGTAADEGGKKLKQAQEAGKPQGRGWGIGIPRRGCVVSNFYGLTKELVYPAVLAAVEAGLNVPAPEAFGGHVISIRDHQNQAFYTNADCTYLAGKTAFRTKYTEHYLREVLNYADKLGLYTRNGAGPGRPLPELELPKVWPYPEVDNKAAVLAGGMFV